MQIVFLSSEKVRTYPLFNKQTPGFLKSNSRIMLELFFAGAKVYSSELLLNGIVIQKLENKRLVFSTQTVRPKELTNENKLLFRHTD